MIKEHSGETGKRKPTQWEPQVAQTPWQPLGWPSWAHLSQRCSERKVINLSRRQHESRQHPPAEAALFHRHMCRERAARRTQVSAISKMESSLFRQNSCQFLTPRPHWSFGNYYLYPNPDRPLDNIFRLDLCLPCLLARSPWKIPLRSWKTYSHQRITQFFHHMRQAKQEDISSNSGRNLHND